MKRIVIAIALLAMLPAFAQAADAPAKPLRAAVDPAKAAEHEKEDIKRHRQIAAAHEAAAKCLESGKAEDACNAELAKACAGIAYGKYCGMKHPD
jgi:hypothetical protein